MFIYSAILIVLIVAVLFAVFQRVDGFTATTVSIRDTLQKAIDANKEVKEKLATAPEFDEVLDEKRLVELSIPFTKSTTGIVVEKPLSATLLKEVDKERAVYEDTLSKLKTNQTIPSDVLTRLETALKKHLVANTARLIYIQSKIGPATVAGVEADDLYAAVGGLSQALKVSDLAYGKEEAPAVTPMVTKEVEERIAKNIATQIKDSLLAERATQNIASDMACPYAATNAISQGQEFAQAKPAIPDMSEYIRKDSIPCWNCSLPETN